MLDEFEEAHLQLLLGRLLRRSGQLDQAVHCLDQAIQQNPESVESYLELGRVYQDRRQYSDAIDAFQQAINIEPADPQAYYLAGQTLKTIKDYAGAEQMLQQAARLAPEDLAIRRQLGGLVALNLVHNRTETTDLYVE
jgi:tetratricopeptide (TPR) repeat protein